MDPWDLQDQLPWYDNPSHWTAYPFDPANPVGPFGPICGPEGSITATWIPDISPDACKQHDDCYGQCAKNCEEYDCKLRCDRQLQFSNWLYGKATEKFGSGTYDKLREGYGCDMCNYTAVS